MDRKTMWMLGGGLVLLLVLVTCLVLALDRSEEQQVPTVFIERTENGGLVLHPESVNEMFAETPSPEEAVFDAWFTPAPTSTPRPYAGNATPAPTPGTDPDVPARTTAADSSYFDDAAFVGNETVVALERYDYDGLFENSEFYEVSSLTNSGYVSYLLERGPYGKIYFGLGGGEMAWRVDDLRSSLDSAIRRIQTQWPGCIIYLMSVSPVSKYRSDISQAIRMDRIGEYNGMLRSLAIDRQVWYLEITSALVNEEGFLPSEVTEDGINYTPGHYQGWYDRIAMHYIGD